MDDTSGKGPVNHLFPLFGPSDKYSYLATVTGLLGHPPLCFRKPSPESLGLARLPKTSV